MLFIKHAIVGLSAHVHTRMAKNETTAYTVRPNHTAPSFNLTAPTPEDITAR